MCLDDGGAAEVRLSAEATKLFYDLVWPQRAFVLRASRVLVANAHDAEDLAQETLMKAFRAIDSFHPGSNIRAWLMTILRNARIDRLRAAGASSQALSLDDLELDPPARADSDEVWFQPQDILGAFSDEQIIEALGDLPEEIRWTLLLVDVEQWDQREAAALLGVPVGTIKSRTHRGRAMLREALRPLARRMVHKQAGV